VSVTFSCVPVDSHHHVPGSPQVNIANINASVVLDLLGLDPVDLYDRVEHANLADLRRRTIRALNGDRSSAVVDGFELPPGHAGVVVVHNQDGAVRIERRGCRLVVGGCTEEQVVRRLRDLLALVVWAQEHGCDVAWS